MHDALVPDVPSMATVDSNAPDSLLPSLNLPYNYTNHGYFASALNHMDDYESVYDLMSTDYMTVYLLRSRMPLTTLREFTMLRLMNELTDKPDWHKKVHRSHKLNFGHGTANTHCYQVFDDGIADKWRKETLRTPDIDITQEMVDWCIEELRYKARIFEKNGMVTVYNGDVVKSDLAVPEDLRNALIKAVESLEDVHPSRRDWHPGSSGKVLDLVHPSLFPLVYGLTRILPHGKISLDDCIKRSGEGVALEFCVDEDYKPRWGRSPFSRKFQWLPCDVDISGDAPR